MGMKAMVAAASASASASVSETFAVTEEVAAVITAPGLWDAVFYTLSISAICFYMITMAVLREFRWLTYAAYAALLLLLWSSLDGTLTGVVSGSQRFADASPLVIGAVTVTFGFLHAAWRIERPHGMSKLKGPFAGFAVVSALLIPGLWVVDSLVPLYAVLNTCMLLMVTGQVIPPITWSNLPPRLHLAAIAWPVLLAASVVGFYALHFLGPGFSRPQLDMGNRVLFLMHLSHILSFAIIYVIEQGRANQEAQRAVADAARQAVENALALERANQQYARARQIATSRARQLAEASHDIRQPINALRNALNNLSDQDPERVGQAIDYLDELATRYLSSSTQDLDRASDETERDEDGLERVSAALLTDTVSQMFLADAASKGIVLRNRAVASAVRAQPLVVTRILSNLVSNAIAHSGATKVLLTGRRRNGQVRFEVRDNGRGMNEATLAESLKPQGRGADSEGAGLGLGIVQTLADDHGLDFSIRSMPGRGTCAGISAPLVVQTAMPMP